MIIEICANSFESAAAAQRAGADRIELCTELSVGGLTPSFGLLQKVTQELDIPVHVLIRPRSGNFTYSENEISVMLKDISMSKELGCAGIVIGALTADRRIDIATIKRLKLAAGNVACTFHRAFDWCTDAMESLLILKDLGMVRLLSSGQEVSAIAGIKMLESLKDASEGDVQIMPGGGISAENIKAFQESGFEAVHFSATKKIQTLMQRPNVSMHSANLFTEGVIATSDEVQIRNMIQKIS